VGPLNAREIQAGDAVHRGEGLVTGRADDPRRDVEVVRVVLDDEHPRHQRAAPVCVSRAVSPPARTRIGRVKWNVLPRPTSLSTQMRPPCKVTSRFEIARPRPVPPYRRVVELSACRNSSNTYACASGLMPTPVSATETVTHPSAAAAETETVPRSVNFTALASMLAST